MNVFCIKIYGVLYILKSNKFDVMHTFEVFNSETINLVKEKIIKLVFIEAENFFLNKSSVVADISGNHSVYLTIVNNKKLFTLINNSLKNVQKKIKNENNNSRIYNKL